MMPDDDEEAGDRPRVLRVASALADGRLEITVADSGPGIAPEQLTRVFEPLYSTKPFGVGLGLPIVKRIAEQHGGGIEIDSHEGAGTSVTLWLPRAVQEARAAS